MKMTTMLRAVLTTALALTPLITTATPTPSNSLQPRALDSTRTFTTDLSNSHCTPNYTTEELYSLTVSFLDAFIYPANLEQARAINSTLFSENVTGRVDATRNFLGRELNTEYLFGLFSTIKNNPNPDFFTILGTPTSYKLTHWSGVGNVVALSNVVYLDAAALPGTTIPFEVDVWLTFDDARQITQYDSTFRWLQWSFDTMTKTGMAALKVSNPLDFQGLIAQKLATSICSIAQTSCTGANQQYADHDECMDFLTKEIRFGQAYELGMDTLLCRMVHQGMVAARPEVHCAHIGKSGGAYCVDDRVYADVVQERIFTESSMIGGGFPGDGDLK